MPTTEPRPRSGKRAAAGGDRLEALHQQLADGVAAIRDGGDWRAWLDTAARFHTYSFNNQILIAAQRPDATLIAGYGAWQAMGRQVRKGEKALWVLAPVTARRQPADREPEEPGDPAGEAAGASRRRVVGFRAVAVFDVSQTDGDPLPAAPRPVLLAGEAPAGLWDALAAAVAGRGFQVRRCPDAAAIRGANGVTDFRDRTVTVRSDVDDAQAVKTLAHEAGHVLLHDPLDPAAGQPDCRGLVEVEAESVAYLVAAHHGLDTAGYTFAYIAGWAGRDDQAITATAGRVLAAARTLAAAADPGATQQDDGIAARAAAAADAARATAARAAASRDALAAATAGPDAERLRTVIAAAQDWFLAQAAGSPDYRAAAEARGHTPAAAIALGAGWAPHTWTGLVDHLRAAGHPDEDLLAAGVAATTRHGRLIDRFRGRITFPIHDHRGAVGFTARDTTGHPEAPKYLNTPATVLFAKSSVLYGTQHIGPDTTTVVLAEGPWDALAVTAAASGTTIGAAACGTAVTSHHLDLLRRGGRTLLLAPDADRAGTDALARTLGMLHSRGDPHPAAVASPPGGDPADALAAGGPGAVRGLLAAARPAGLVLAEARLADLPPGGSPEARIAAARAAAAAGGMLTPAQREELRGILVDRAGITPAAAAAVVGETVGPVVPPKHAAAAASAAAPAAAVRRPGVRL